MAGGDHRNITILWEQSQVLQAMVLGISLVCFELINFVNFITITSV